MPIVLPRLPDTLLPNIPNVKLKVPPIPLLPALPDLPDLPTLGTLPSVVLPDLPPAPMIPRIPSSIQGVLDIVRLLVKVICILRINPFVPEWRAGDQIALLTERKNYLPIDTMFPEPPQLSISGLPDAFHINSFVNLEFDTDFVVEFTRQALAPVKEFSTNMSNKASSALVRGMGELGQQGSRTYDASNMLPSSIDIGGTWR
jgi:hypothetical protein